MKTYNFILLLLLLISCEKKGIGDIERYGKTGATHLIVEIPAGTIREYEYDSKEKGFKTFVENGKDRTIGYFPYPFNVGFIPPYKNQDKTEVIIISETYSIGTVLDGEVIGALEYKFKNKLKYLFVAFPLNDEYKFIESKDLSINDSINSDIIGLILKFYSKTNPEYIFNGNIISKEEANNKMKTN